MMRQDLETRTIYIEVEDEEGALVEASIPGCFEVCGRCDGTGTHVDPAIDGNGLSREDFDADPQFEEDYFSGVYDVACWDCKGLRVVLVIDEALATVEQHKQYRDYINAEADYKRERDAELRMGY